MTEITIPTVDRSDTEVHTLTAVYIPDGDLPGEVEEGDWDLIPEDVAEELALEEGDKLQVDQRRVIHTDEGRIGRQAANSEHGIDPMDLLQAHINESVTDSNIRIHPKSEDERKTYDQVTVDDMDTPHLAWFLYRWLGTNQIMHHLVNAGSEIEQRKKKS